MGETDAEEKFLLTGRIWYWPPGISGGNGQPRETSPPTDEDDADVDAAEREREDDIIRMLDI